MTDKNNAPDTNIDIDLLESLKAQGTLAHFEYPKLTNPLEDIFFFIEKMKELTGGSDLSLGFFEREPGISQAYAVRVRWFIGDELHSSEYYLSREELSRLQDVTLSNEFFSQYMFPIFERKIREAYKP